MKSVEKTITVDRPVNVCYNQWTQFEEFPRFMEGVKRVEQIDDKRLRWTAEIAGKKKRWEAEITYQDPDERIAWRSTSGAPNEGSVTFEGKGNNACRIRLALSYEPEGATETVGAALGIVGARVEGDLKRFKEFIESRPAETGAWRGEIKNREVKRTGEAAAPMGSAGRRSTTPAATKREGPTVRR